MLGSDQLNNIVLGNAQEHRESTYSSFFDTMIYFRYRSILGNDYNSWYKYFISMSGRLHPRNRQSIFWLINTFNEKTVPLLPMA